MVIESALQLNRKRKTLEKIQNACWGWSECDWLMSAVCYSSSGFRDFVSVFWVDEHDPSLIIRASAMKIYSHK